MNGYIALQQCQSEIYRCALGLGLWNSRVPSLQICPRGSGIFAMRQKKGYILLYIVLYAFSIFADGLNA